MFYKFTIVITTPRYNQYQAEVTQHYFGDESAEASLKCELCINQVLELCLSPGLQGDGDDKPVSHDEKELKPRFDPGGYDKDLVEALERDILQSNPNITWCVRILRTQCSCTS